MNTPEIPPPPRLPTRTSGRPSRFAAVTRWGAVVAGIIAALGGGAGLRALWGQGEEQIRQNARILAAVESLEKADEKREARIQAIEHRERVNWSRWETAHAMHFAAAKQEGYKPPRDAPDATDQIRYAPTRNAKKPALASDQQGRALALPEAAEPPPGP